MELKISKTLNRQIGNVRVSDKVFKKIEEISKKEKVNKQEVVRAILEQVIDEIK